MDDQLLSIRREGACVFLAVKVQYLSTFSFSFDAGTEWAAQLLVDRLRDVLGGSMQKARAAAYADGWKNAKHKTAKQAWFSPWLP